MAFVALIGVQKRTLYFCRSVGPDFGGFGRPVEDIFLGDECFTVPEIGVVEDPQRC